MPKFLALQIGIIWKYKRCHKIEKNGTLAKLNRATKIPNYALNKICIDKFLIVSYLNLYLFQKMKLNDITFIHRYYRKSGSFALSLYIVIIL